MYFADHWPPHFRAEYGEHEAVIGIEDLRAIAGSLPARALGLVEEWALIHQADPAKCYPPLLKLRLLNDEGELTSFGEDREGIRYYHVEVSNQRRWSPARDVSVHVTLIPVPRRLGKWHRHSCLCLTEQ
jgi:hypothetical protein